MTRRVALATLGCKTNQFESAAMQERLVASGYQVVPFEEGAELVIVNTCTVTAATDSQSRNLVRRARRFNPDCRVVVTGCYAQVDPQALVGLPGVSLVIGNEEKSAFLEYLENDRQKQVAVSDIRAVDAACVMPLASWSGRSRAFVQIQNGCDAFCSYCIIPYARGRSRSVLPDQVVEQVAALSAQGVPEVVLTGIHIGAYGADLEPSISLASLVRRIADETTLQRLRLGSIEPQELTAELIDRLVQTPIVCRHLHIPLQSGDDEVLKRMNRHYTTAQFRSLLEGLVQREPDLAIGLDVITGFPGESAAEHENTCALIASLPVSNLHVFPFSKRPGTAAATMAGHLPGDIIKQRAAQLRELGAQKQRAYAQRFIGRKLQVVVESGVRDGKLKGLSREYLEVRFSGNEEDRGKEVTVSIEGVRGDSLYGVVSR
ncbi:MAG: tRNA (N(6)-L-threonylcarbamoyladenosine(37)-C(2))-methylthiotransferase MtaB [Desulfuromonas sp.]|nr:MAG: tRNA (N(6)-L-threonylcarbamoyladenosine(37)-C(2))-methylthiotransferase MtaB [Desulfuromonas sp.]